MRACSSTAFAPPAKCGSSRRRCFSSGSFFRTRSRNGVLVLASLFERHVEIVADIGFDGRVDAAQWRSVVDTMTPELTDGRPADAFLRALERIEAILGDNGFTRDPSGGDALADRPIETQGER
jgi:uncharacterized membrane protein